MTIDQRAKTNARLRERYKNEPTLKAKRMNFQILRNALKRPSWNSTNKCELLTGLNPGDLKSYLISTYEARFGTWSEELYLLGEIETDHRVPLVLAETVEEMNQLFNFSNLAFVPKWFNRLKKTRLESEVA